MVRFSIITPFYKGNQYVPNLVKMAEANERTLREAGIEAEVELLLINDSPEIQVELPEASQNGRVQLYVINHKKNGGIHQARITGLRACRGEYILFLDQDDEVVDHCLLTEYNAIGKGDVVIANAWLEQPDKTKEILYKTKGAYANALSLKAYVKGHNRIVSPGHCLIRKEAIPEEWTQYVMKDNGSDDLFLWILMLVKRKKFVTVEQVLYTHKHTGMNLSAEGVKMSYSSMETAKYLKEIAYVPAWVVKDLVRSRTMEIQMENKSKMEKIGSMLKNADIYAMRAFWKLRGR